MSLEQPYRWSADGETDPIVGIIAGSQNDFPKVESAFDTLEKLEIPYEVDITSAHRLPELMAEYSASARNRGLHVLIAVAGGSAHLQGMSAGHCRIPVLGVAVGSTPDSLNAAVGSQIKMPGGVPLSYMGDHKAGAQNAALQAARILALHDSELDGRLEAYRQNMVDEVNGHRDVLREIGPHKLIEQLKK